MEGRLDRAFFSKKILNEYLRVLAYPKFSLSETGIEFLLKHEILPYFQAIDIPSENHEVIIESDPDDDKFLLCALSGTCDFIISGDRHLLELKIISRNKNSHPSGFPGNDEKVNGRISRALRIKVFPPLLRKKRHKKTYYLTTPSETGKITWQKSSLLMMIRR